MIKINVKTIKNQNETITKYLLNTAQATITIV